ncbi:unnamed protein product [Bursaphelenchus okinawaensis]|uniref:Uncharacterized protein n=1 Tax=Bursaphelenchus okinawaensis TaxID=465554 RepID=A0A811L9P4_9BILA|nr:unnamed protein product [Bursaphelenchus okinawaensis]CAG9121657.1 unnamed protein product [Bursaphelenchus okinawaensis]
MDSGSQRYTLSWSYQLNENQCTTGIVLPVTITQSLCFLSYTCSSLFFRWLYSDVDDIRLHGLNNITYLFCQLSLLLATVSFYKHYLRSYNTRKRRFLNSQHSQSTLEHFTFLERQLKDAYDKREYYSKYQY